MLVTEEAQRQALTSPVRIEILEHFVASGPASVRELAEQMNRSPHAIHYHVRNLLEVGLIAKVDTQKSGKRDQAVYDAVAEQFELSPATNTDASSRGEVELKAIRAAFRRAEREFEALAATGLEPFDEGNASAGRMRARLSSKARQDVTRHLTAIQKIFADEIRKDHPPQTKLQMYTFTSAFLPEV